MRAVLWLICLLYFTLPVHLSRQRLENFKSQMENLVKDLADKYKQKFDDRCQNQFVNCSRKSVNSCAGTSERICMTDLKTPNNCEGEEYHQGVVLSETSNIILPPNKRNSNQQPVLSKEDMQFICISADLENHFQLLDQNRNKSYIWTYVASNTGLMRIFPSDQICRRYDPRFRPWYAAGATGQKNIVVVLDISHSMNTSNPKKISLATDAIDSMLNTTNQNDYFSVVVFNDTAKELLGRTKLYVASSQNIKSVKDELDNLKPDGPSYYQAAFAKTFQILDQSQLDNVGGFSCSRNIFSNIIIFITDAIGTESVSRDALFNQIDKQIQSYNITLFTYVVGSSDSQDRINTTILKQLSCKYNGITFQIESGSSNSSELVEEVSSYFTYLSSVYEPRADWVQFYEDAFQIGQITTVSYPIYDNRILLGVAGIDFTLSYLQSQFGLSKSVIQEVLIKDPDCPVNIIGSCELQRLRNQTNEGGVCNISEQCSPTPSSLCQTQQYNNSAEIFKSPVNKTRSDLCCYVKEQPPPPPIWAMILFPILGVLLIAIIAILIKRKKDHERQRDRMRPRPPSSAHGSSNKDADAAMQKQQERPQQSDRQFHVKE